MSGAKLWEGLWRSDKTQLQTGPRLRTRMWYFHVGRPTAAWHTPLWSMWRGAVLSCIPFALLIQCGNECQDKVSEGSANPSPAHSQSTQASAHPPPLPSVAMTAVWRRMDGKWLHRTHTNKSAQLCNVYCCKNSCNSFSQSKHPNYSSIYCLCSHLITLPIIHTPKTAW